MHDDETDPMAQSFPARYGGFLDALAPPGTARRVALKFARRGLKAIPKLTSRRYVAHKVKIALIRARGSLILGLRPYRNLGERLLRRSSPRPASPAADLSFPIHDRVEVSIIIPVFNHCGDTRDCLASIARLTDGPASEVIVVDDGSTDETSELLGRVEGLVLLRNEANLGFIGSCNRGAVAARGEFLVFLNNDTLVTPGWLQALRRTFDDIPGTGLAARSCSIPMAGFRRPAV